MAAPPPYDDSQKYNPGQGPPGYYPQQPGPPGNYPQDQEPRRAPAVVVVNRGPMGMFGKDPVTTTCPNCQANVRRKFYYGYGWLKMTGFYFLDHNLCSS